MQIATPLESLGELYNGAPRRNHWSSPEAVGTSDIPPLLIIILTQSRYRSALTPPEEIYPLTLFAQSG